MTTTDPEPPRWARAMLRVVTSRHFETAYGDLLEEYRMAIHPSRGKRSANVWFIREVLSIAWRSPLAWALGLLIVWKGGLIAVPLVWYLDHKTNWFGDDIVTFADHTQFAVLAAIICGWIGRRFWQRRDVAQG